MLPWGTDSGSQHPGWHRSDLLGSSPFSTFFRCSRNVPALPRGLFPPPADGILLEYSAYSFSDSTSSSEDSPGIGKAWCQTVCSCLAVMLCNLLDIHGVRVIMSSQDTLDPGSRPRFTESITYFARALAGRTHPPYTAPSVTVASSVQNLQHRH